MVERDVTAPDGIEPLVAWRYWRLGSGFSLRSLTGSQPEWVPGRRMEACCRFERVATHDTRYQLVGGFDPSPHSCPGEGCTCGIYAAADLQGLRGQLLLGLGSVVVGEVFLWGKVIPARHGYRAQYAYPRRLYVFEHVANRAPVALSALERYGGPVDVIPSERAAFSPTAAVSNALGTVLGSSVGSPGAT